MHAEQLTNPRSNLLTFKRSNASTFHSSNLPTFNFQPKRSGANFVRPNLQPKTFVPQTTNQEHAPITSNYTRKQSFMAHQNGQKIFVPGKKNLKYFLLKNQGSIPHLASSTYPSSAIDSQRSNASTLQSSIRQLSTIARQPSIFNLSAAAQPSTGWRLILEKVNSNNKSKQFPKPSLSPLFAPDSRPRGRQKDRIE